MKNFNYSISELDADDRKMYIEMLPYVSHYIESTEVKEDDILVTHNYSDSEIISKMDYLKNLLISSELKGVNNVKIETIYDNTQINPLNKNGVYQKLINENVYEVSSGSYAYSGLFLEVFNYFCQKINSFAKERFPDIIPFDVPVLSRIVDYDRGKYFENFPHHIMFQTTMINDNEVLDEFSKFGTKDRDIFSKMKAPVNVLRHASCAPIYPILENQQIDPENPKCFLVSGKCFRNEGDNVFELARLNEFYMKEFVFVGSPQKCKNYTDQSKDLWNYWIDVFGLNCKIDTANDSFFASNYKKLKLFQVLGDSKQEFKLLLPYSNTYIAASSLNIHRTHFTKEYNIKNDNSYCHSSCFAFGIERLSYALISQKGLNIDKWDNNTLSELSKYIDLGIS